jgi:hypothetical protein
MDGMGSANSLSGKKQQFTVYDSELATFCLYSKRLSFIQTTPAQVAKVGQRTDRLGEQNMKRLLAFGVIWAAVGVLLAAPVSVDNAKPAAFPAGHYVLGGSGEPARGEDVFEFMKPFQLRSTQYILSGGPKPTDVIFDDDDLEVYQDKTKLFVDDDHVRSTENRGKRPARYKGEPIVLVLDAPKKLRIVAIDCSPTEAIIGELWLHRWDGARKKLTDRVSMNSPPNLPAVFFDESYPLDNGFEKPEKISTDAAQVLPEKPSKLLPRFQSPEQPDAAKLPSCR